MTQKFPEILDLSIIQQHLNPADLIKVIEQGFVAYSHDKAVVPPVGELLFQNPPGEAHIKYGYIKENPYYVIKIASGFYENSKFGIKSSQGLMLLFSQQTGELVAILLDEGYLTDVRTTIASMITLKYLAPKNINKIGIIGTGTQARLQLSFLNKVCNCRDIIIWGRNKESCLVFQDFFRDSNFYITILDSISELAENSSVIITTTPSKTPLLELKQVKKGTHITCIGSDTSEKNELSPEIIKNADVVVSDSIVQSKSRGEVYQARINNCLNKNKLIELGTLINQPKKGRTNDEQITVADLTGVAVQDIMIATSIFNNYKNK